MTIKYFCDKCDNQIEQKTPKSIHVSGVSVILCKKCLTFFSFIKTKKIKDNQDDDF